MDVISYALSKKYVDDTVLGMGSLKGSNCYISSIVDNSDGTHDITFSWKDTSDVTHTSVLTVSDGETPTFTSTVITGGHRITFTTEDRTVSFDVMDGSQGASGISVISSNVDDNNNLTFTLSNGNTISAGTINAVTTVDTALSTSSSNPVENKVITNALNNKVDKESGKGLSTEDFTTAEKDKLSNIEDNAQVNVIEKLIINGTEATVTDKAVALTLITSAVSNLQNYYLKTETYTKTEIEDLIGSTVGVTIEIVEELPTEGQSNVIYFLPTETTDVYSQYLYTADGWILIGSTTVDLSNYYTKTQVDTLLAAKQNTLTIDSFPTSLSNNPVASGGVYTAIAQMQSQFQYSNMPTASADNLGYVYQYIGATGTYTQNMFYRCIYDDTLGEYQWQEVIFNATITIDSAIDSTSENPVQNKVIKTALDEKQDTIQYSTMPSAEDNLGKIVQYSGTTTSTYTNGYFYKATYDSDNDLYYWKQVALAEGLTVDSALSNSSENPVQNKVITNAITEITDLIPSDASSSNQLVDRDSLGTASQKDATSYVRPNNYNLVESNAVYNAIANAVSSIYTPHGNITVAELLPALLISTNVGNVYTVTDSGTTTEYFMQGEGVTINSGDAVGIIQAGEDTSSILFNLMGNMIDLSDYQTKELSESIEGETTVEDALSALSTNSQAIQTEVNDIVNVYGAKNLLPNEATTQTICGVTFTVNDDGSVTVNGTATANINFYICNKFILKKGTYILSKPYEDAVSFSDTYIWVRDSEGNTIKFTTTADAEFTLANDTECNCILAVNSGYNASNKMCYPMIRLASIQDDTYVPYAMTSQQITPYVQAISNPNLVDNPWFTVNQRGITSYSASSYGVDRWKCTSMSNRTTEVVANGIKDTSTGEGSTSHCFYQYIDAAGLKLKGKTVTVTVYIPEITSDTEVNLLCRNSNWSGFSRIAIYTTGYHSMTFTIPSDTTDTIIIDCELTSVVESGKYAIIGAIKLELGSVSTLAMDTVPNYAEELLKCQRYFQRLETENTSLLSIGIGFAVTTTDLRIEFPISVHMRTTPNVTYSGLSDFKYTQTTGSAGVSPTNIASAGGQFGNGVVIKFIGTFTAGDTYEIYTEGGYIDLSADL